MSKTFTRLLLPLDIYKSQAIKYVFLCVIMTTIILDNTYLLKIKDLEKNATAMIGTMNEGSYEEFSEKMLKVAKEAGIVKPQMAIGVTFKVKEVIGILDSSDKWSMYKEDINSMRQQMPKVFVIDGSKFKVLSL